MTFRLGLTGSIGMGKSTTAQMFRDAGVPVWDADASVAQLYAPGGAAGAALTGLNPGFMAADGSVDRAALKAAIGHDPESLARIESIVHPLVAKDRQAFIAAQEASGVPIVVLDIPLLFETGADADMDAVAVVSVPPQVQRDRVLARPGMTAQMFDRLLAAQMPDSNKRARADFVIETRYMDSARARVQDILTQLQADIDA